METGIIVCGCNGSGKSTLGKELAAALQYNFIDIEDWLKTTECFIIRVDGTKAIEENVRLILYELFERRIIKK